MRTAQLDPQRGYLNKWEMYRALRGRRLGPFRLPYTERLSRASLVRMLHRYRRVYVKPVDGWGGHGIGVMERRGPAWLWRRMGEAPRPLASERAAVDAVLTAFDGHPAVVQQAAPLLRYRDRPFDIRAHAQRDAEDRWVYAGALARIGGAGAFVSNVAVTGGTVEPVEAVLHPLLGPQPTREVMRKLPRIARSVAQALDAYRLFEEVGLDLGVDRAGHLWLLEVNTDDALGAPSHELFAELPDRRIYEAMRARAEARQKAWVRWLIGALEEGVKSGVASGSASTGDAEGCGLPSGGMPPIMGTM
ncbi:YheC/YheD family protein [Alicyclobacillus sp.]|uniref:YheC/YheD family protein n=1 Tax=Alicyclobacillus sp. TaxID=61169 RepID=UPI0025B8BC5D|nr:YheC/YheD family protein [Alicyclobacillus sp.]MCL6517760.1 YheC/YheD family protein [Alicyclobacillus sp.]